MRGNFELCIPPDGLRDEILDLEKAAKKALDARDRIANGLCYAYGKPAGAKCTVVRASGTRKKAEVLWVRWKNDKITYTFVERKPMGRRREVHVYADDMVIWDDDCGK